MPLPCSHSSPGATHSTAFPTSDPQFLCNNPEKRSGFQETPISMVHMNSHRLFPQTHGNLLPGLCTGTEQGETPTSMDGSARRTCVVYSVCRTRCTAEALAERHWEGLDLHPAPYVPPAMWVHYSRRIVAFSPLPGQEAGFLSPCQHHPENSWKSHLRGPATAGAPRYLSEQQVLEPEGALTSLRRCP